MANWCQPLPDENTNPNLPPLLLQIPAANALTDINLAKLATLLKPALTPHHPPPPTIPPKTYTGIAKGVDPKGQTNYILLEPRLDSQP